MKQQIERLIKEKQQAVDALENAILDEMGRVATSKKITKMVIHYYGTSYYRQEKEVACKALDDLDQLYCDKVHIGGFQGIWEKGKWI